MKSNINVLLDEIKCDIKTVEAIIQYIKHCYIHIDVDYIDIMERNSIDARSKIIKILEILDDE